MKSFLLTCVGLAACLASPALAHAATATLGAAIAAEAAYVLSRRPRRSRRS